MPSLVDAPGRHTIIDRRPGQYISFPDLALAADGALLAVYREADRHVARRRKLLARRSVDGGRSWGPPVMLSAHTGHCPRITVLPDGQVAVLDDDGARLYWSLDHGRTFSFHPAKGFVHGLPDRLLPLDQETFLGAGHLHRGTHPHPLTRQPTTEQMCYVSRNQGLDWEARAVMAFDPCLVLCEASMARMSDGRLFALLRENSGVGEPMYFVESRDDGLTWSAPAPTPLVGHRPTLGLTRAGQLLVTYRDVGPEAGSVAWLGDVHELRADFAVHGRIPAPGVLTLTPEALRLDSPGGADNAVRYLLRPLSDPRRATAGLSLDLEILSAEANGLAVRFGGHWFRLSPGAVRVDGRKPVPLAPGRHELSFRYAPSRVSLAVDGKARLRLDADPEHADTRPVSLGAADIRAANAASWRLYGLRHETDEPRYGRGYRLAWTPTDGLPDAYVRKKVLMLAHARGAIGPDFGYSGWAELPDGSLIAAYHHALGDAPDYVPGLTSWVEACRFAAEDWA